MPNQTSCKVEGCLSHSRARGFCEAHYSRWYRHGDPRGGRPTKKGEPMQWMKEHISHTGNECLTWPFATLSNGYGEISRNGSTMGTHRLMCELAHGLAPTEDHQAAHSCGNGHLGCVNPRHLRWATSAENLSDRASHGTLNRGVRNGKAILSEDQVREIKKLKGTLSERKIAALFNVSRATVNFILSGRNWAWLD